MVMMIAMLMITKIIIFSSQSGIIIVLHLLVIITGIFNIMILLIWIL